MIDDGITKILIDVGISWKRIQKKLDFKTHEIHGVLIDHSHGDHAGHAKDAIKAGLDIYTSKGTIDKLKLSGHRVHVVKAGEQFEIGSWRVLPFDAIHDAPEPLGFLLANTIGERLLFLTDSAYVEHQFEGLTHIMIEANYIGDILSKNILDGHIPAIVGKRVRRNHMSLENLITMLKANDLSRCRAIYLMHLSSANSDEEAMRKKIQEITGVPVYICGE